MRTPQTSFLKQRWWKIRELEWNFRSPEIVKRKSFDAMRMLDTLRKVRLDWLGRGVVGKSHLMGLGGVVDGKAEGMEVGAFGEQGRAAMLGLGSRVEHAMQETLRQILQHKLAFGGPYAVCESEAGNGHILASRTVELTGGYYLCFLLSPSHSVLTPFPLQHLYFLHVVLCILSIFLLT